MTKKKKTPKFDRDDLSMLLAYSGRNSQYTHPLSIHDTLLIMAVVALNEIVNTRGIGRDDLGFDSSYDLASLIDHYLRNKFGAPGRHRAAEAAQALKFHYDQYCLKRGVVKREIDAPL